jgi:tetratricopeptide (TPR) repeat protein
MTRRLLVFVLLLAAPSSACRAGLYYSGEKLAELPSRWRGFLLDQRALRQVAVRTAPGRPAGPLRTRYEQEAARLAKRVGKLGADEAADLGALYLRLGEPARALEVLRVAQRLHPVHFRLAANLGTAWQMHGDLAQAAAALEQAVRLAPGKHVAAEKLHLRLVRLRQHDRGGAVALDNLFGVRWVGPGGGYEPGRLAPAQRKELPAAAGALAQQLALWLPADPRLLWQLAELANAHGDVTTAAAIMDGCVTEFGLRHADLLAHRKVVRAAADDLKKARPGTKKEHEAHALLFKPRSSRPLLSKVVLSALPAIDPRGLNTLAWEVIGETTVDRQARPTFAKYLRELDGKRVVLHGYLQPISEDGGLGAFLLIEHPVGCWYCEMPELTHMVLVEMPEGKAARYSRARLRVTGKLKLNATDPENFLYLVQDAEVRQEAGD